MKQIDRKRFVDHYKGLAIVNHHATQSFIKNWIYVLAILKSTKFNNLINKLRIKYKIPVAIRNKRTSKKIKTKSINLKTWWEASVSFAKKRKYWKERNKILLGYGLHYIDWEDTFDEYIFNRRIIPPPNGHEIGALCQIADLRDEYREQFSAEIRHADVKIFPIAIRLNPNATKRDIIDYVNNIYPELRQSLDRYKDKNAKVGKLKERDTLTTQIYEYAYSLRKYKIKTIAERITRKYNLFYDDGHIGKMISLEAKRRNEL